MRYIEAIRRRNPSGLIRSSIWLYETSADRRTHKQSLAFLDHVRAGGEVTIVDRNQPIARIVPIAKSGTQAEAEEARLDRLERKGLIRRGKGAPPDWLKRHKPLKVRGSVLQGLLDERESGW